MGIISWIVVGLVAGWLAGMVMKGGGYGVIGDIILGVVGAIVGGFLGSTFLGVGVNGINLESIIVAAVGAVIVVFASRLVSRGGRRAL
jgi:uncharacterized membrane protein YeaQ/YmgE (transglycosylase-associated protein family)